MKKKVIIAVIVIIVCVCVGFIAYLNSDSYKYKATHLPKGTVINGVDCSDMTKDEAVKAVTDKWDSQTFKVIRNGKTVAKFPMKGIQYDIDKKVAGFIGDGFYDVLKKHAGSDKKEHTISMKITDSKAFDRKVMKNKFLDIPYKVKTKDAYIDMRDTNFNIVPEVYGDNVDKKMVAGKIDKLIAKGDFKFNFVPKDNIDVPEIKKDDKVLKDEIKFDKKHYTQNFIYEKFNGEYKIRPIDIKKMRPVDKDGNATINEKEIEKFMKTLAWNVNTQYFDRKFKSTNAGMITVYGGTYGYALDKKKEAKQLAKDLEANKDFKREPVFAQKPYYTGKDKHDGHGDIGDSYAEVSIGSQTLWLYVNGKQVLATAVTTGRSGNDTEKGVYYIEYKQRGATLSGPDYSNKVAYWMPFNGDQGCHDATWRSDFGSSGYVTSGSHGCVNMPYYEAAAMYSKVERGFPIVVH